MHSGRLMRLAIAVEVAAEAEIVEVNRRWLSLTSKQ